MIVSSQHIQGDSMVVLEATYIVMVQFRSHHKKILIFSGRTSHLFCYRGALATLTHAERRAHSTNSVNTGKRVPRIPRVHVQGTAQMRN